VLTSQRLSELYDSDVDVLRVRGRIIVVGTPDAAHGEPDGGHHHHPVGDDHGHDSHDHAHAEPSAGAWL
jgi:zinc/manganese transport system ATP-binding protein